MFDWNDEELLNIIWGEDWESKNCNDPFSVQIEDLCKKGTHEQTSGTNTVEGKKSSCKSAHGIKLDRVSVDDVGERALVFCHDSWATPANPSPPNIAKVAQDSVCTDESSYLREDEASELDRNSEMFEKAADDEQDRDNGFYGWANIGSFEDLDRVFSGNDTIFGNLADSNADALWSSSKDFTDAPLKLIPFSGDSKDHSEITDHNVLYPSQSSSGYRKMKHETLQNVQTFETEGRIQESQKLLDNKTVANRNAALEKGYRKRRTKIHSVPSMVNASLEVDQQSPSVQNSQLFQQKHLSSVNLDPPVDGSMMNYYPGLLSSGYQAPPISANSSRKSGDAPGKPPPMTPREKIEKLRRRQQMRAILAIQKQQMHFNNQTSVSEDLSLEGGKVAAVQSVSNLPIHDGSSVTEKDDLRTVNMVIGNCSVEESILYRLQETIAKLDMRIRHSIRDSLFRLAKSAMQRQYPNDTNSTCASSKDEACSNKDMIKNQRFAKMTDMETETNPIDRIVARLLFHVDLSGKLNVSESIANGHLLNVSESSQTTSSSGRKSSSMFSSENLSGSSPFHQARVGMEAKACN